MASEHQQVVELQRSVRYGRLLIGGAVVGGVVGALVATLFPIAQGSMYSMNQIAGFMLLIGGVAGLTLGGILALVLTRVARRGRGTGVIAVSTEKHETETETSADGDASASA